MRDAWKTIGTAGLSVLLGIALVGATAAIAAEEQSSGDPWLPELIAVLGPNGALLYLAWIIGRTQGIPLTVSVQMSKDDREALDRISRRMTIILRHLDNHQ